MSEQQPVFYAKDDLEMKKAFQKAQQNFRYFWRELSWERRRIVPGLGIACVKIAFTQAVEGQEPLVEHMWVNDVVFDGETIRGVLLNEPNHVTHVKSGQAVVVPLSHVSDWLFAREGKTFGGFSIQAMRKEMSHEEREAHDDAWGFDFGDYNQVQVAAGQNEHPEYLEEHPMSVNMREKVSEFVKQYPNEVNLADDAGNTLLHREAIAGNKTPIEVFIEAGADIHAKNKLGKTAYDYAMEIGWPHLLPLLDPSATK